MATTVFRQKTMERISSPEQLTDYLRVTNPGIWLILSAVGFLLAGLLVWSAVGTLETTVDARAVIRDNTARIVTVGTDSTGISAGMPLRLASQEFIISSVDVDEYGRTVAHTEISLPDGSYDAKIVTERIHPISFLLESR